MIRQSFDIIDDMAERYLDVRDEIKRQGVSMNVKQGTKRTVADLLDSIESDGYLKIYGKGVYTLFSPSMDTVTKGPIEGVTQDREIKNPIDMTVVYPPAGIKTGGSEPDVQEGATRITSVYRPIQGDATNEDVTQEEEEE